MRVKIEKKTFRGKPKSAACRTRFSHPVVVCRRNEVSKSNFLCLLSLLIDRFGIVCGCVNYGSRQRACLTSLAFEKKPWSGRSTALGHHPCKHLHSVEAFTHFSHLPCPLTPYPLRHSITFARSSPPLAPRPPPHPSKHFVSPPPPQWLKNMSGNEGITNKNSFQ